MVYAAKCFTHFRSLSRWMWSSVQYFSTCCCIERMWINASDWKPVTSNIICKNIKCAFEEKRVLYLMRKRCGYVWKILWPCISELAWHRDAAGVQVTLICCIRETGRRFQRASRATPIRSSTRDASVCETLFASKCAVRNFQWVIEKVLLFIIVIMKMEQNKARHSPKESPSHHTEMLLALLTHREELRKGTWASMKPTFAVYAEQFCV